MLRPAEALALTPTEQQYFLNAMLFETFGFYLPFFIIGPYCAAKLRPQFGVIIDTATLCLAAYVLLGIAGTSMQIAALRALATSHASGGAMIQAATEASWLGLVFATEHGLWPMEGPVMAFWGWVIGRSLHQSGARFGRFLMCVGVLYGIFFIAVFADITSLSSLFQTLAITLLPLWMLLSGIDLLRQGQREESGASGPRLNSP